MRLICTLDGIDTRMRRELVQERRFFPNSYRIQCPCGHTWSDTARGLEARMPSLRYHHAHCPQARVAPGGEE